LPLRVRRRAEAIGGSHRGNTAIKNTSYGAYDIGRMLPPGEYYRRKPQGVVTGGGSKGSIIIRAYATGEYCHRGHIVRGVRWRRSAAIGGTL